MDLTNIRTKYKLSDYSDKTVAFMDNLISSLEVNFDECDPSWLSQLDLIAMNANIMFNAYDDIQANGKLQEDSRGRLQKNVSITLYCNAFNNLNNLLSRNAFNIIGKARAKQLMKDVEDMKDSFESEFEN